MLTLDPANPVIVAIGRGMQSEITGDRQAARAAYTEAWDRATDDFERCIAAHYVPRVMDDPGDKLRWNEDALRHATAVGDERVAGFFASLHASSVRPGSASVMPRALARRSSWLRPVSRRCRPALTGTGWWP